MRSYNSSIVMCVLREVSYIRRFGYLRMRIGSPSAPAAARASASACDVEDDREDDREGEESEASDGGAFGVADSRRDPRVFLRAMAWRSSRSAPADDLWSGSCVCVNGIFRRPGDRGSIR
jgi:hypothetical protein